MAKIKNDPGRYVSRASMGGRQPMAVPEKEEASRTRTAQDFRDAHIDDGLYVTFKARDRHGKD